jgi:hypothetical protein
MQPTRAMIMSPSVFTGVTQGTVARHHGQIMMDTPAADTMD